MKSKNLIIFFSFTLLLLSNCGSSNDVKNEANENTVPSELKDTVVIQSDEEKALEKLNNVIDTTKK